MKKEKASPKEKAAKSKSAALSVSPSAWMVWEKCALSLQNVKSSFQLERDEFAKKGTELHEAIAQVLRGTGTYSDDNEDVAIIRFAVDTVCNELDTHTISVETTMSFRYVAADGKNVLFSGIADVEATKTDTVFIIDFKTGWREVEAENNSQLKLYAHIKAANDKKIKYWKGIIINARFNSVSYTGGDIEPDYLAKTAKDILDRTKKKQVKTGNHCAYCQRLSTCTHIRKAIAAWCKPGAIDSITREPEKLAEALRLAKPAEKLFDTIKKEAQLFIELGGEIPGTKVEYIAGTRTWPRDMSQQDIANRLGLMYNEMIEESFKTPAQAEKIGADKDAVNSIAIRPPRKGFKFN